MKPAEQHRFSNRNRKQMQHLGAAASTTRSKDRREKNRYRFFAIAAIIIAGLLFQCIILFFIIDPDELFWYDPKHHYSIAKGLFEGYPYSTAEDEYNLYRSPGYPFVLSLMMRMVGTDIINLRLVHVALFPIFLLSLYKLGSLWKYHRVGLITMLFGALYPPFLYIPLTLYPESLLIYLFPWICLLIFYLRDRMNYLLVCFLAVMISLAVMIRPTSVVWIPVALVYLLRRKGYGMKKIIALGAIITMIPTSAAAGWCVRNEIVHHRFIFSTAASKNLWISYSENGTWRADSLGVPKNIQKGLVSTEDANESDKSRAEEALRFISKHPLKASKRAFMLMLKLWSPIPHIRTEGYITQLKYRIIAAIPFLCFLILGMIGIIIERKDLFVKSLLLLMVLNTIINGSITTSVRYRVVTDFALILTASFVINLLVRQNLDKKD